ncbi:MAG: hypothetical protein OXC40_07080 [Proteobacteria bacterium]|nr:hypothetical protein [Pseudomonadota bacterium]
MLSSTNYQGPSSHYGEPFELWIVILMSTLIILSFVGVGWLWHHYSPSCQVMEYTYCPENNNQEHHKSKQNSEH